MRHRQRSLGLSIRLVYHTVAMGEQSLSGPGTGDNISIDEETGLLVRFLTGQRRILIYLIRFQSSPLRVSFLPYAP